MPRWLLIALTVVGLAAFGVVEGLISNRWGSSEDLTAAASRLDRVPTGFGDWTSTEEPLEPKVAKVAEAAGNVSRIYANRKISEQIAVLLLCGPAGPIGAHTPDVCYAGAGYKMIGTPSRRTIVVPEIGAQTFWSARFQKPVAADTPLLVTWAWSTEGNWLAANSPRQDFLFRKVLYKLYVVRGLRGSGEDPQAAPKQVDAFLTEFLPLVRTALAPNPG